MEAAINSDLGPEVKLANNSDSGPEVKPTSGPEVKPANNSDSGTEVNPTNNSDSGPEVKPPVIYRCKKCRRIVASKEHIVPHEQGGGQKCFKWKKRSNNSREEDPECSSIFVEPMKWMETLEEGHVEQKLQCIGCKARLGSFNWAGMQCNCGAWITPAFQLHKSRLDECAL